MLQEVNDLIGPTKLLIIKILKKYRWEFRNTNILSRKEMIFETDIYIDNVFYCKMKCKDVGTSKIDYEGPFASLLHGKLEDIITLEGFKLKKDLHSGLKSSLGMMMFIASIIWVRDVGLALGAKTVIIVKENPKEEVEDEIFQSLLNNYILEGYDKELNNTKSIIKLLKNDGYDDEYQIMNRLWEK